MGGLSKEGCLRRGDIQVESLISLSIPAPLSSLEQPLEVPPRKGCRRSLWADSLKPRSQTDQQAGRPHTEHRRTHTKEEGQDGRRRERRRKNRAREKGDTTVKKLDCEDESLERRVSAENK